MEVVHIVIVGMMMTLEVLPLKCEYIVYRTRIQSMVVDINNNKMIVIIPIEMDMLMQFLLNAPRNHIRWQK